MKDCPKNKQCGGNLGNRAQSSLVALPDKFVPRGATSSIGGGETAFMQSQAAKSKRTLQMLSHVRSKFLLLMFMLC